MKEAKEYNQEIEAYTKLLMKCVTEEDFFDEGLVHYLLNYKKEIIEGYYFKQREYYGVIKSNLWGYVKNNANDAKKEKWAKILNIDINEPAKYQYLKFNFYEREKRDRNTEYKPLFFKGYGKTDNYLEVSEEFLRITKDHYGENKTPIQVNELSETEMKLIINDCLNDSNVNTYGRLEKIAGFDKLIDRIKNFLINHFEEIESLAKEDKKGFLRLISMGNNLINESFQSIEGKEREEFIEKHKLEEKLLTYMRYKNINKDFFIECLYNYKNKDFWLKTLNCYAKSKNRFSVSDAIKDIILISNSLEDMFESKTYNQSINWKKFNYYTIVDEEYDNKKYERIGKILNFFKEELKNAVNYKEEMEKLMLVAIGKENKELYKIVKNFMRKENGYQEDMEFNHPVFKKVCEEQQDFLRKMKEEEIEEFNEKLENKLIAKEIKSKPNKI